jgi:hypothetical protein
VRGKHLSTCSPRHRAHGSSEDVFVPWEHVFVLRDRQVTTGQWNRTPAHLLGNNQAQIVADFKNPEARADPNRLATAASSGSSS